MGDSIGKGSIDWISKGCCVNAWECGWRACSVPSVHGQESGGRGLLGESGGGSVRMHAGMHAWVALHPGLADGDGRE